MNFAGGFFTNKLMRVPELLNNLQVIYSSNPFISSASKIIHYNRPINLTKMIDCQCHSRGSIHLILGPMFSGKTTELFRLTNRHKLAGKKVGIVKYLADTRYDASMASTHDSHKMEAISALKLEDVLEQLQKYEVIGIDEGQFFIDLVDYSQELANTGKVVIIAALNGDYKQEYYENIAMLISHAERIEKLSAVCRDCGHSASFTFRNCPSTKREVIGGEDLYQAVCRACYIRLETQQNSKTSEEEGNVGKETPAAAKSTSLVRGVARLASSSVSDAPYSKLSRFTPQPLVVQAAAVKI